ncbi:Glyoxylase, beta-lactamase superfamily II [Paenibacillus sp. UNCCL117]|uniref:MBL fold metallo-hydrolase n=1 Tax=unclassified Paenibacillus TaxID=185978 RepID=UPI00088A6727|nr:MULTISPECIES: MBL fold metallo-hydrolase [unclassified Paenibacillus]SDE10366.1 Glyoxylase, beta-lactamase superfamily II [Paenibacillus sp. cl123]SFW59748.1 Glyoxylase, beta-lactamase superfamily II [Paenibacillus sp. UNCCL117]
MRIAERVYLVGSGKFGMELSEPTDCNVYLLDGGEECALIDAGGGLEPERIEAHIEASGFRMERVRTLVLTHAHADHAAGAAYFQKTYGMKVIAAAEAAPWLEGGDMDKTSLRHAQRGGVYPPGFVFPPCPVARTVREGDEIAIGDLTLRVIDSPGHARGHICLLWEEGGQRSLFAGDTVFAGGKVVIQYIWDCRIDEYAATLAKLHALGADRLFPGHGPFLLARAHAHIERAHACFERLEVPPNL